MIESMNRPLPRPVPVRFCMIALSLLFLGGLARADQKPAKARSRPLPPFTAFSCSFDRLTPFREGDVLAVNLKAPLLADGPHAEEQARAGKLTVYFDPTLPDRQKGILKFPYTFDRSKIQGAFCEVTFGVEGAKALQDEEGRPDGWVVKTSEAAKGETCILRIEKSGPSLMLARAEGEFCARNPSRIQTISCQGKEGNFNVTDLQSALGEAAELERGCRPKDLPPAPKASASEAAQCETSGMGGMFGAITPQMMEMQKLFTELQARYLKDRTDPKTIEMYRKWMAASLRSGAMSFTPEGVSDSLLIQLTAQELQFEKGWREQGAGQNKKLIEESDAIIRLAGIQSVRQEVEAKIAAGETGAALAEKIRVMNRARQAASVRRIEEMPSDQLGRLMENDPFLSPGMMGGGIIMGPAEPQPEGF